MNLKKYLEESAEETRRNMCRKCKKAEATVNAQLTEPINPETSLCWGEP